MKKGEREAIVDKILSKSFSLEGMTAADLVRAGREKREEIFGSDNST